MDKKALFCGHETFWQKRFAALATFLYFPIYQILLDSLPRLNLPLLGCRHTTNDKAIK